MQKKSSVLGLAHCRLSFLELPLVCYAVRKAHITGLCPQEIYNLLRKMICFCAEKELERVGKDRISTSEKGVCGYVRN